MVENNKTSDLVITIKNLNSVDAAAFMLLLSEVMKKVSGAETKEISFSYNNTPKTPAYCGPG